MRTASPDVRGLGRIVRGHVSASGGIVSGVGFTVVRNSVGIFTVTFTPVFQRPPMCGAITVGGGTTVFFSLPVTASQLQVGMWRPDQATYYDSAFQFIATEANPA